MTGVPVSAEGPSHPRAWPAVGDRVVWNPGDEEDLPGTVVSVEGRTATVAWDQGDECRVYNRHLRPLSEVPDVPVTSPESPSSLLERAADLIENLACGASVAPWVNAVHDGDPARFFNVIGGAGYPLFGSSCCNGNCPGHVTLAGDSAWIATLNPSVAPPLVAWLRQAAAYFDRLSRFPTAEVGPQADTDPYAGPAVQFARLILGES